MHLSILLDEATASLDVENETQVQEALSRLLVGKTVIVIAHRMRTVMNADKIVVLKEGRVVEQGTPEILMKDDRGLFRRNGVTAKRKCTVGSLGLIIALGCRLKCGTRLL